MGKKYLQMGKSFMEPWKGLRDNDKKWKKGLRGLGEWKRKLVNFGSLQKG